MLDRQAVRKGDILTFMDPIRSDGSTDQKIGEFVFTEDDIVAEDDEGLFSEENLKEEQEIFEAEITLDEELKTTSYETVNTSNSEITNVIREEMIILRESLQAEIKSLRKEFGKD